MAFPALFFAHAIVVLTCGASLAVLAAQFKDRPGTRFWAAAGIFLTAGLLSFSLYGVAPFVGFALLGNLLTLAGYGALLQATREAAGVDNQDPRVDWAALGTGFVLLALVTATTVRDGIMPSETWFDDRALFSSWVVSIGMLFFLGRALAVVRCGRVLRRKYWMIYVVGLVILLAGLQSRLIATLWIYFSGGRNFETINFAFFLLTMGATVLVTIGAIAITAGDLYAELRRTAMRDPHTALLNRRGFFELLSRRLVGAETPRGFSLIIADIDNFKSVNDSYGHDVGDAVIAHFGQILSTHARKSDLVARFGGEEFVLALHQSSRDETCQLAERLRRMTEQSAVEIGDHQICYTASFGVAEHCGMVDFDTLFRRADQALLNAKATGRNCVIAAENT